MTQATITRPTEAIASWELALRAERKSPATIKVYTDGVQRYLIWCTALGAEPMDRTSLTLWIAGMLDAGRAPGTPACDYWRCVGSWLGRSSSGDFRRTRSWV